MACAADAVLLHNNLGGVAGTYCASSTPGVGDDTERCSTQMSQLGDFGAASLYPDCAGKALDDMCYTGIGARWPRTNAVPAGTGLPQRPPCASCAVFGNVFTPASTSALGASAIDLYIENTTYYPNWVHAPPPNMSLSRLRPPKRAPCDVALPCSRPSCSP